MNAVERTAVAILGAVSIASVGAARWLHDKWAILELRPGSPSVLLAIGLGACAVLAGLVGLRWAAAVLGALFLAAAVVQVPVWGSADNWLGGNGSTSSLWLGLGAGLLAVGLADRLWPDRPRR